MNEKLKIQFEKWHKENKTYDAIDWNGNDPYDHSRTMEMFDIWKSSYKLGRDAQRESDASLFLIHGDYSSSMVVYEIKNNTGYL
jgi:hypothetical protein